ncbi:MAG: hypothetical protein CMN87_12695 [Stappia sp.]|uniref:hypothetical protein n=1 Tax=Stappia sp. TaxID=1870903 RepID=UPI000C42BDDA|nr:hypothetical protein [Stappia sp.]MAA98322.1 hypothetical protein [Stappia sp.]MBM20859.1 hypothetical protein [Stappia sp.]|tara:strand:+ start:38 stop:391 length:354 start_codon:yes stop_codon:yes gene_type:complete
MTTSRKETATQSGALILLVLSHVFFLPVAGAFLPAEVLRLGTDNGLDTQTSYTVLGGIFLLLILLFHGLSFRMARARGENRLSVIVIAFFLLSLAALALFGIPSPLVAVVHAAGFVI